VQLNATILANANGPALRNREVPTPLTKLMRFGSQFSIRVSDALAAHRSDQDALEIAGVRGAGAYIPK